MCWCVRARQAPGLHFAPRCLACHTPDSQRSAAPRQGIRQYHGGAKNLPTFEASETLTAAGQRCEGLGSRDSRRAHRDSRGQLLGFGRGSEGSLDQCPSPQWAVGGNLCVPRTRRDRGRANVRCRQIGSEIPRQKFVASSAPGRPRQTDSVWSSRPQQRRRVLVVRGFQKLGPWEWRVEVAARVLVYRGPGGDNDVHVSFCSSVLD
jgi:hypothetical protein